MDVCPLIYDTPGYSDEECGCNGNKSMEIAIQTDQMSAVSMVHVSTLSRSFHFNSHLKQLSISNKTQKFCYSIKMGVHIWVYMY